MLGRGMGGEEIAVYSPGQHSPRNVFFEANGVPAKKVPRCFQWNGVSYFHPGGMPAISRGLREARALPPDTQRKYPDPGPGSQAFHSREGMTSGLASIQDAICSWLAFRWYRCARPPANRSEPFRFWGDHLHHAILAGRARVRKAQGNSEFEESPGWPPLALLYSVENSEEPISRGPSKLESAAKYSNHAKTSTLSCISRGSRLRFISWSFRTGLCKSLIS